MQGACPSVWGLRQPIRPHCTKGTLRLRCGHPCSHAASRPPDSTPRGSPQQGEDKLCLPPPCQLYKTWPGAAHALLSQPLGPLVTSGECAGTLAFRVVGSGDKIAVRPGGSEVLPTHPVSRSSALFSQHARWSQLARPGTSFVLPLPEPPTWTTSFGVCSHPCSIQIRSAGDLCGPGAWMKAGLGRFSSHQFLLCWNLLPAWIWLETGSVC